MAAVAHLLLPSNRLPAVEGGGKEDIETLLHRQEDETSDHGAKIVDDVIDPCARGRRQVHKASRSQPVNTSVLVFPRCVRWLLGSANRKPPAVDAGSY